MLTYLAISSARPIGAGEANAMAGHAAAYLPPLYDRKPQLEYHASDGHTHVFVWRPSLCDFAPYIIENNASLTLITGYITAHAPTEAAEITQSLNRNTSFVDFNKPVGGMYSLFHLQKTAGEFSVVQSKSGLETVFVGQENQLVTASNRPDIAHMGMRLGRGPSLRRDLEIDLMNTYYLIDGSTHFSDLKRIDLSLIHI